MSTTGNICEALETFGATIGSGEIDNRPLPEQGQIETAINCMIEPITSLFDDCPLVQDVESLLWGMVNAFHAQLNRVARALDDNERTQARLRAQHDGSEINDTSLREAIDHGQGLVDRQNAFLLMFDAASRAFEETTGCAWQSRHGSRQRTRHLTAAMIDSRDVTRARATKWYEDHLPKGPYVVVSGGQEFQDIDTIWSTLDRIKSKHDTFVLLHGGNKGVDTVAANWADNRGITQIRYGLHKRNANDRAAGFRRNEKMLAEMPIGVVTFPGNGVTEALKREARNMGIPVLDYGERQQRCGRRDDTSPVTTASPEAIIAKLGVDLIARHFGIQKKTVATWQTKGVPASRVEAILILNR